MPSYFMSSTQPTNNNVIVYSSLKGYLFASSPAPSTGRSRVRISYKTAALELGGLQCLALG